MLLTSKYCPATNTRGSRISVTVGDEHTAYATSWDYYDLLGDDHGKSVHRAGVYRMLALLGSDVEGPVVVDAGSTARGFQFAVLNGPASLQQAEIKALGLGMPAGSLLCPVRLWVPLVPEVGERVQLTPSYWPTVGQYATVVSREGKFGVWFKVQSESTGRTSKVSRGSML